MTRMSVFASSGSDWIQISNQKIFTGLKRSEKTNYLSTFSTSAIPVNRDFNEKKFKRLSKLFDRAVVVIKWSECLPSIPKIRVRIPLKSTIFCKIVVKKEENFW